MNILSAKMYLQQSLQELHRHHGSCTNDPLRAELRYVRNGRGTDHVQIWWTSLPSPRNDILWDVFDVEYASPDYMHTLTSNTGVSADLRVVSGGIAPAYNRPLPDVPLFRYHPQRFRAYAPFAKNLVRLAESATGSMFTPDTLNAVAREYIESQHGPGVYLFRWRNADTNKRGFTEAIELGSFFCDFIRAGRQIFDFPQNLVEMFRHTDVDDIPLDALQFPYPCFYLYFGSQSDLETKPGWHPDGAYVSVLDGTHVQMLLTSAPPDVLTYSRWMSVAEPIYIQGMGPEQMRIGVGEASEMVLAETINQLKKEINGSGFQPGIDAAVDRARAEGIDVPEAATFVDSSRQNARAALEMLPAKHAAWREMLKLVVNAIAYLSAYPDDTEQRWPDNMPQSLYLQLQDGTPKQKQRARSKLASLGFTSVHLCGKRLRKQYEHSTDPAQGDDVIRKPTWVRGHWVRQPYGPKHSLRRLQWRMPHLRNAAELPAPEETGHIYAVG